MEIAKYEVKVERNVLIPLSDGATLAADLYRPDADGGFPALFSFYPYHKDDLIGAATEFQRRYFAARGGSPRSRGATATSACSECRTAEFHR